MSSRHESALIETRRDEIHAEKETCFWVPLTRAEVLLIVASFSNSTKHGFAPSKLRAIRELTELLTDLIEFRDVPE